MVRLLSGLALAGLALAAILFLPTIALRVVAVVVALIATSEYLNIIGTPRPYAGAAITLVTVSTWQLAVPGRPEPYLALAITALLFAAVDVLFRKQSISDVVTREFAALYIGLPLGLLVAIHTRAGREAVLLLIGTIVVSDSMQYYTGRLLGRRPLAPAISPKKTIEGAIGGVVFGTAFMVIVGRMLFPSVTTPVLLAFGAAIVVLGIAGDLFESKLKRTAGVKDSSALIPGHGGILDRIDALLFAIPAFFVFVDGFL